MHGPTASIIAFANTSGVNISGINIGGIKGPRACGAMRI
jgi:hypothetical protein